MPDRVDDGSLRSIVSAWLHEEGHLWVFVLKACLAALLALWVALRLGFDSPGTAMTTVFIVAQPQSGLVLAKSFYRLLGTLTGLLFTLLIVATLSQSRELFLLAMSVWIGLCVAGASWFRDFQAYAFLLAGYTSCMIGFSAVQNPDAFFEIAVTRVSEIVLGILCATVVSDALFPERLSPKLVQTVRGQFKHFIEFLHEAVAAPLDRTVTLADQIDFVSGVLTLESLRAATLFEDPEARLRSDRFRLFNADFMTVSTTLHALQRHAARLRAHGRVQALVELRPCVDALGPALLHEGRAPAMAAEAVDVIDQLRAFQTQLNVQLQQSRDHLAGRVSAGELFDFDCIAELFEQFVTELLRFTETYVSLMDVRSRAPRPAPAMAWHSEPRVAFGAGLRALCALLALTWFWIATAWPDGGGAATIACVGCALFASSPAPARAVRQMGLGFLLGLGAAYICGFHVLNQMDGFTQLALGLMPFMMVGAWLAAHPKTVGVGAGFSIMLTTGLQPQNVMHFNVTSFLNNGLSQLIGLGVAALAFSLLTSQDAQAVATRIAARLRHELVNACRKPLRQLPHAFDGHVRDLMRRVMAEPPSVRDTLLPCALSVLVLGDAVIDLRQCLTQAARPAVVRALLADLAGLFEQPTAARRAALIAQIRHYLATATDGQELVAGGHLERCLHRLCSGLADDDWYAAFTTGASAARTQEPVHAA